MPAMSRGVNPRLTPKEARLWLSNSFMSALVRSDTRHNTPHGQPNPSKNVHRHTPYRKHQRWESAKHRLVQIPCTISASSTAADDALLPAPPLSRTCLENKQRLSGT